MGSVRNDGERPERNRELRRQEAKTLRVLRQGENERVERLVADRGGPAALPRKDGELVFNSPWESRAFGLAVALHEQGIFSDWEEFRSRLIIEIADWESRNRDSLESWSYYERWLAALERLVVEKGLLSREEIDEKAGECAKDKGHAQRGAVSPRQAAPLDTPCVGGA